MFHAIFTQRLILRAFEPRDAAAFAAYRSDPEVARYQGWEAPYSLEQAERFIREMSAARPGEPGEWYQAAAELRESGALIGDCAFKILREDRRQAEIGVTLARAFQGQGYAREMIEALLEHLFVERDLHRVRANIDPRNHASARLLRGLGFRHEGRFVESLWFKGGWADEDWYALLRREWLPG